VSESRRRPGRWHLAVVALLYSGVIPVAILDDVQLRSGRGGGDWIRLDLHGLYVMVYAAVIALIAAIVLLHMSLRRLKARLNLGLLAACLGGPALASFAVVHAYFQVARSLGERREAASADEELASKAAISRDVHVHWRVIGGAASHIVVELTSSRRFDVQSMGASGSDAEGRTFANTVSRPGFTLEPGVRREETLLFNDFARPSRATRWSLDVGFALPGRSLTVTWGDPELVPGP
jgi:hypothetical protein